MSLEWTHPWALGFLIVPFVLIAASNWRARPRVVATATLRIWRDLAERQDAQGRRSRFRVPPAILLLAGATGLAALALAQPRPVSAGAPKTLRFLVDVSPSMYLADANGSRLRRTVRFAEELVRSRLGGSDRAIWEREIDGVVEVVESREFPSEWFRAPRTPQPEPRFRENDRSGTWWLTDRDPGETERAGVIASGGEARPGPVAESGTELVTWDGSGLVTSESDGPAGIVTWAPGARASLPPDVVKFVRVWAELRGLELGESDEARLRLRSVEATSASASAVRLGRDGWTCEGEARSVGTDLANAERWLSDERGTYVALRPGEIVCGLGATTRFGGDRAAFAVSWGALFDRALLPRAEIVAFEERQDAGPFRMGEPDGAETASDAPGTPPAAWLATAAFALAALAWLVGRFSGLKH